MGRTIESIKHDLRIQAFGAFIENSNAGHGFIYGSINRALFRNISFGRRRSGEDRKTLGPPKSRRDSEKHNFHDKFIRSQERLLSCCSSSFQITPRIFIFIASYGLLRDVVVSCQMMEQIIRFEL